MSYKDAEYHKQKSKEHYMKYKESYNARNKIQKDRTKEIIEEAKAVGCIIPDCGETEMACLDFHHLGDKDKTISQMRGMSDKRVLEEIAKCIVLCANCHRKVHAGILTLPLKY